MELLDRVRVTAAATDTPLLIGCEGTLIAYDPQAPLCYRVVLVGERPGPWWFREGEIEPAAQERERAA